MKDNDKKLEKEASIVRYIEDDMTKPIQLNDENLNILSAAIKIPLYRRSEVCAGVVHIGIGGFHRAHQAYFIDRLLEQGWATDWGICGVALLESDRKIYDVLSKQDGLYTLMIPDAEGHFSAQVIGSIVELLYAPENPSVVIARIADASIRLITLTITEGGYNFTSDGDFNWENERVKWDLQHPDQPKTIFGYLYAGLKRRRELGVGGLTIQSCDNMEHNGDILRRMLYAFIVKAHPEMTNWLNEHVTFPNSMVDRITPATTEKLKTALEDGFGLCDEWPVMCEPFYQWIIQDTYAAGRPAWEEVGAQLVSDVTPYEKMKIRLLNGGHTLVGLMGDLLGYQYVHESVADPSIARLLDKYMDTEVTPTLDALPGIDLTSYKATLVKRFKNPFIKDEVTRIISGSSAKLPKFILPVVFDRLKQNGSVNVAAFIVAIWYQYLKKNLSSPHKVQDERATVLLKYVAQAEVKQDPLLFLDLTEVFGDLREQLAFTEGFQLHMEAIDREGARCWIEGS